MKHIPVRETVIAAYTYTFGNIGKLVGLVWLPALLSFAGSYVFIRPYLYLMSTNPTQDEMMQHGQLMAGVYGFYIVGMFLIALMAAGIARDVMAPDKEPGVYHFPPFRSVMRVAAGLFSLLLLTALVTGLVSMVLTLAGKTLPAILFVVLLALIYLGVRLAFFLVPAATAQKGFGLIESWQLSAGHFWRLLAVLACCALPVLIVSMLAQLSILGPDYYSSMHVSGAPNAADSARMVLMADRFWLIAGVNFFLTPFAYGLYVAPTAMLYRKLTDEKADKTDTDKKDAADASDTDEKK